MLILLTVSLLWLLNLLEVCLHAFHLVLSCMDHVEQWWLWLYRRDLLF